MKSTFWRVINRIAALNYYTARAYYKYRLYRKDKQFTEPPLLIYQMGKVGSKTIKKSLENLKLNMPVYHIHGLSDTFIKMREERSKRYFLTAKAHYMGISVPWLAQYLRKQIGKRLDEKKIKIITLVRDPIPRKISSFFEIIDKVECKDEGHTYKLISYRHEFEFTGNIGDVKELTKLFIEISKKNARNDQSRNFFEREFKGVLGIDIFASEFPTSKGWKIYNEELADVLLIRLENLNECYRAAFKEFLNIGEISLLDSNIGGEKAYAPIYQEFRKSVKLPKTFTDEMYNTKYAQHFYSREEIDTFKKRWSG